MRSIPRLSFSIGIIGVLSAAVFAYDPPRGGETVPFYASPTLIASGSQVASTESPAADSLNPAASAAQQRTVLDAGYTAIVGTGDQSGWGSGIGLGITLPQPYGVWSASTAFLTIPDSLSSYPLGTSFSLRGSFAKDLYPDLFVGAGLGAVFGGDWGLALDIGMIRVQGDVGFLRDLSWGAAFTGLGKWYAPAGTGAAGGAASAFPSPFTLTVGAKADLLQTEDFRFGNSLDLSFPSFQNLIANIGFEAAFRDLLLLRGGWNLNLHELLNGPAAIVPSVGLTLRFVLESGSADSYIARQGWNNSEIRPTLAVRPLYDGVMAVSTGVNAQLGVIDRDPPIVKLTYPTTSWGPYYLSPNADGKKDELTMPLSIVEKRYLTSYALSVFKGDPGTEPVRVIANKESRPETEGVKGLWDRLLYVKKGIPVPPELVWNGFTDAGVAAADGRYTIVVEATDDNGNRGKSEVYEVIVDATPPALTVQAPADAAQLIFSPDGDGSKDTLTIAQTGSVEDVWQGRVLDASGNTIRTVEYKELAPTDYVWDGKSDAEAVAPDGVYSYAIEATDRADNRTQADLKNIVVNTQQPPLSITIDLGAFSPNGDGIKDTVSLLPSAPVRTGLVFWKLAVLDEAKKERWSVSGTDAAGLKEKFVYDGRDSAGTVLAEGSYRGYLELRYVNGYAPKANSPVFVVDLTAPKAGASVARTVFNPVGSDDQNRAVFSLSGSSEPAWKAEALSADGKTVRVWEYIETPDARLEWDGRDESGRVVSDGVYSFRLSATDRAGNYGEAKIAAIRVDTEKKAAVISVDARAFSPNGDGIKDTVRIIPEVRSTDSPASWEIVVRAAVDKNVVRSWKGTGALPAELIWEGRKDDRSATPDGDYRVELSLRFANLDSVSADAGTLMLDTVPPKATLAAAPLLFSPNGDGRKDEVRFEQSSVGDDDWEGVIAATGASGTAVGAASVRTWKWRGSVGPFSWNGADEAGNAVPDGEYRYRLTSTDAAGNSASYEIPRIVVDNRQAQVFVTASRTGFSPNGDGKFDNIRFSTIVNLREGVESWRLVVADAESGTVRKTWAVDGVATLPQVLDWDGKGDDGTIAQGNFIARFTVSYAKGDVVEAKSASFLVDVEGPKLSVKTQPELFSPDNDGVDDELSAAISVADASEIESWRFEIVEVSVEEGSGPRKERSFALWTGTGKPAERISWDGKSNKGELVEAATDYPYYFIATDVLGNTTRIDGKINVDVLVIRDGDRLKIKVPSIVFRPNFADFQGLDQEKIDRNAVVIKRIAQILNRFREYKVRIEGHANSIGKIYNYTAEKIAKEEAEELLPLSTNRAEAVRSQLVQYGVDARRLSVRGLGSSEPVTDFKDGDNRWKNRRVEFILIKE